LYQDIGSQRPHPLQHRQSTPATRLSHPVKITPKSLLSSDRQHRTMRVNSSHHQSVKDVAPSLQASARAPGWHHRSH
jgi:putative glutamine amidotransferase